MGEGSVTEQLQKTHDAIINTTGVTPKLMRPPYGAFTANQRTWANAKWGYKIILWDVDPLDWKVRNAEHVKSEILRHTVPARSSSRTTSISPPSMPCLTRSTV
jgi:peptidoglycan/xylan/chitin deacetylase (PgdA/CDA1 family)